jgi:TonB family protein
MRIRKAIPWIVSFAAHVVLAVAAASILSVSPDIPQRIVQVDVQLVSQAGGRGRAPANRGPSAARVTGAASPPAAVGDSTHSTVPQGPATGVVPYGGQVARNDSTLPSVQDVLSDLSATTQAGSSVIMPGEGKIAPGKSGRIGGEGAPRKLIRRRDPQFPVILSAAGQEGAVEARITIAPSGLVTRVEITRSSGYTEVDASVEAALRDYLFSRVNGRLDAVESWRIRFRLEKMD